MGKDHHPPAGTKRKHPSSFNPVRLGTVTRATGMVSGGSVQQAVMEGPVRQGVGGGVGAGVWEMKAVVLA